MSKLPNLIIIGAMKAGTTSLYEYLKTHPDVFMASPKEIDYFFMSKNYSKGIEWYKSHFNTDKKIIGEASPNYSKNKNTPKLIYQAVPEAKLIYILRDPVKRLISQMRHSQISPDVFQKNKDWGSLQIVKNSMYYSTINNFLNYFNKNQIHVLTLENLQNKPIKEMNKICNFLDIGYFEKSDFFQKRFHQSDKKKIKKEITVKITKQKLVKRIKDKIPAKYYNKLFRNKIFGSLLYSSGVPKIDLPENLKKELYKILLPEMEKITDLFDIDNSFSKQDGKTFND